MGGISPYCVICRYSQANSMRGWPARLHRGPRKGVSLCHAADADARIYAAAATVVVRAKVAANSSSARLSVLAI